ncbi:GNAT family N-acetyltransferase [Hymenobacter aerilatus]|uniref:GNAT family N-acetyltransferase n=1 Tax=Hymenobacter aerilatus TaxID=2932251 RepID=A0A8T9SRB5_9BACT|nr:GNAT family N-acetyltransferase [Hymenobacter aerilatus]UOR04287.1 GNAT family N-acetyltransferase [Hymenobacter aerilatus]
MSLRYLPFAALDLAAWDICVHEARPALPYAYAWWLHIVVGHWDAVVEVGPTGEYRSVLPLPYKHRPWGKELIQPVFTQQLGLLTTATSRYRDIDKYLLLISGQYTPGYQQLNVDNSLLSTASAYKLGQRVTYHLSLTPTFPNLLRAYDPSTQRRLRQNQARPTPLVVQAVTAFEPLISLFKQTKGPAAGLSARHYMRLRRLIEAAQQRGQALLYEVRAPEPDAELLAASLFIRERNSLIYLFAAASPHGRQLSAPTLLLSHVIAQHAGTPGLVLDFEGSVIPSIARFFANFGAQPVPYGTFTLTSRPWYLQWMR